MSRYDGLIIPRSYSEYINKTDAATLQQALQLPGVLSDTVQNGDNKPVKSDAVNNLLGNKSVMMSKNTQYNVTVTINTWYRIVELPNIPSAGSSFLLYINKIYVNTIRTGAFLLINYNTGYTTNSILLSATKLGIAGSSTNFSKLRIVKSEDNKYYLEAYITKNESFNVYVINLISTETATAKTAAENTETELVQIDV